jgi:HTH-type transcriptional regulator/antitoxin HipB
VEQIARDARQIGQALRRRRKTLGLTQAAVGKKAQVRQETVSKLESGRSGAPLHTMLAVLRALNLELVIRERSKAELDIEDLF